jgi:hypothetical protein
VVLSLLEIAAPLVPICIYLDLQVTKEPHRNQWKAPGALMKAMSGSGGGPTGGFHDDFMLMLFEYV